MARTCKRVLGNGFVAAAVLLCGILIGCRVADAQKVNNDSQTLAEFRARAAEYVKVHNKARSGLVKGNGSAEAIGGRERQLAGRIHALRRDAKHGSIFTPPISSEFRRLAKISSQGNSGKHIETSLARSEPVQLPIHVNAAYPTSAPLQSTPPTLLRSE
ncbi:MAG: hypothetical protein ACJ74Y_02770 [Bryobacteraceae bacterium]